LNISRFLTFKVTICPRKNREGYSTQSNKRFELSCERDVLFTLEI